MIILTVGKCVRLSNWQECVLEIQDIGEFSIWGKVIEIKTGIVRDHRYVGFKDDEWMSVLEVKK